MCLSLMEVDANDIMKRLAEHKSDPDAFCKALTEITGGVVDYSAKEETGGAEEDSKV